MIELHLIGYTADLEHLVLDVDPDRDRGDYRLVIDADLFATLDEIRAGRRVAGMETGDEWVEDEAATADPDPDPEPDPPPQPDPPAEPDPTRASGADPGPVVVAVPPRPRRDAKLSPAEIQDLLRRGRSVRSVARAAGTDPEWIERWLPPIEAERRRVLEAAWGQRLERARLGRSREPLREAVDRSLRDRRVAPDGVVWEASRRVNGTWSVAVRYTQRGRSRSATWSYDPADGVLRAASEVARELGFTRPRPRRRRS